MSIIYYRRVYYGRYNYVGSSNIISGNDWSSRLLNGEKRMSVPEKKLKIKSVFLSVNGECCKAAPGSWTVFVRTFGCSARCSYCDTKYSWEEKELTEGEKTQLDWCQAEHPEQYKEMHPVDVFAEIVKTSGGCKRVTLTGGEPLEQDIDALIELIVLLERQGFEVSIETNGMMQHKIKLIQRGVRIGRGLNSFFWCNTTFVADLKLPSSGNPWRKMIGHTAEEKLSDKIIQRNLDVWLNQYCKPNLSIHDFVKFVISNEEDFKWAMFAAKWILNKPDHPKIYFSPCNISAPGLLFEWMKEAGCAEKDIGYSMQIHKIIFPGDWRDEEK